VEIGKNCTISRAIIDEGCVIPDGMTIGANREADAQRFYVTEQGVVLVTADMLKK
jgi:glucose-1-phosphate adenylyltransferase